jgi:hypothetical protein
MKECPAVLIITTIVVATIFDLFRKEARHRAAESRLQQIRDTVELAETVAMHRKRRRLRGTVHQIHQYLLPVPKGVKKTAPKPQKTNSRISRFGCSAKYKLRNTPTAKKLNIGPFRYLLGLDE